MIQKAFTCRNCGKRPNLWHRRNSTALHRWTVRSNFPHRHMSEKAERLVVELSR